MREPGASPATSASVLETAASSRYIVTPSQRMKVGWSGSKPCSFRESNQDCWLKSVGANVTLLQSTPATRSASTLTCCVGGSSTSKNFTPAPVGPAPSGSRPYARVSQPAPRKTNCRIGLSSAAAAAMAVSKKCVRWLMKVINVDGRGPG